MDDRELYPFSNGNHSKIDPNENEMFDEEEVDENNEEQVDRPVQRPVQPVPNNERGGRRKGVPRRLQLSPEINKCPPARLLPATLTKTAPSAVHHHEQPILTSDQEDEPDLEDLYQQNQTEQNYLQLDFLSKEMIDDNNNSFYDDYEEILETVDDILADIVTIIVRDVRQQRRKIPLDSATKAPIDLKKKPSSQPMNKHKLSPTASPVVKRQKTSETGTTNSNSSPSLALQQQQLLWEMTQQLMMSAAAANESESLAAVNSSLLKQQLLGLNQSDPLTKGATATATATKSRPTTKVRPPSPVLPSNPNPTSSSPYERANFAPRRRGRPPKYVTERGLTSLPSLDLDPSTLTSSYDQLLTAIENGMTSNANNVAFQSALASMLGQQQAAAAAAAALASIPPPTTAPRNGTPASMMKNGAGQTRHSLPATKTSLGGGLDMPLMATKKRGPGRPPKSQALFDSHQILQATQRFNSSNGNHFPPTMVPSSGAAFPFNAAFADLLQQQHPH